jgi:5-methylcytosine-specific restriction endonuclease McrA
MKCLTCKKENNNPKFCSLSCSATYNNTIRPKRSQEGVCVECKQLIPSTRKYCKQCRPVLASDRRNRKIDNWLAGEWDGGTTSGLSKIIRNFLLEEAKYSCSKCGFNTPHPDDNKTILEINHIDGDGTNHTRSNLEVICPNCHALTSTYRGRNVGHGRPVSYIRKSKV